MKHIYVIEGHKMVVDLKAQIENSFNFSGVNAYRLTADGKTTGLETIDAGINHFNQDGMTPIQVALQAGNRKEVDAILAHPDCDATKLSMAGRDTLHYVDLFERGNPSQSEIGTAMRLTVRDAVKQKLAGEEGDNFDYTYTAARVPTNTV